jgi:hypothetical protein
MDSTILNQARIIREHNDKVLVSLVTGLEPYFPDEFLDERAAATF